MKYFVKGWYANEKQRKKAIKEYEEYYSSIENQLSDSVKQIIEHRHDTHIVKTYFENKDYVMELDEYVWGKVKFIFQNATIKKNGKLEDEYWLYDEIYKVGDKIEIHILFDKADIIILCDDAYIDLKEKEYFKMLYEAMNTKNNSNDINNFIKTLNESEMSEEEKEQLKRLFLSEEINPILNLKDEDTIADSIENKEMICGINMLNVWEQLIFNFIQIYKCIKYNDIEYKIEFFYYNYSQKEKEEIYAQLFVDFEKNITKSINILRKYQDAIKDDDLNYVINKLQGVHNKENMSMKEKNLIYLKANKELENIDFNKIYKRILDCINEGLIK